MWKKKAEMTTRLRGGVLEITRYQKAAPATPWRPGGRYGWRVWKDGHLVQEVRGYDTVELAEEVARKTRDLLWPHFRVRVPAELREEVTTS